MHAPRTSPAPADLATEFANLAVGLGILTFVLFPFALPALLLVVGPLVPVAVVGALLAVPVVLPVWLARIVWRRLARAYQPRRIRRPTAAISSSLSSSGL